MEDFNGLNCFYTNTDSLPNKLDDLKSRVQNADINYDVIGITEIYPKNCRYAPDNAELNLTGYDLFLNDQKDNKRGVALYINQNLKAEEIYFETDFQENKWMKVKLKRNDKLLIGCIYRSLNSTEDNTNKLNELLLKISSKREFTHLLIMGDFNLPKLDWANWTSKDKEGEKFMENIRDCYLYQHITEYTRTRANCEPSILDLVFSNEEDMIENIRHESPLGHSDHCVINFRFKCYYNIDQETTQRWNYFKGKYEEMDKELDIEWEEKLQGKNPDEMIEIFLDIYNTARKNCIPLVNSKAGLKAKKHNYIPLDAKTVEKIKKKHRCWQRYMETRDEKKYKEYTRVRNQVKGMVRKAKLNMEKEIAKNVKESPKKFWQYANSKRKTKSGISELKYKNKEGSITTTKGDKEKAEVLAEFFTSVFTNEPDGELPHIDRVPVQKPFIDKDMTTSEILKILKELNQNKSAGPDELHPKSLHELRNSISKPLEIIFNASLQSGQVPNLWKLGNVVAIFKKGDKSDPGNYRPVSLTSVIGKLMEKLVRNQIVNHMVFNSLFSKQQFGFIAGRSTTLQLLKVMDEWRDFGQWRHYRRFMKAFDKVPHKRLIKKNGKIWHK